MTDGHLNPDLIPSAVHRRMALSLADEAHLRSCASCRLEWDLVKEAAGLGAGRLAGFDAGRVAGAVQARLAASPTRPGHPWRLPIALAAAAILMLAVWYSQRGPVDPAHPAPGEPPGLVLQELDSLDVAQLELVLAAIPGEASHVEPVPLSTLNAADLERVLRSMEE